MPRKTATAKAAGIVELERQMDEMAMMKLKLEAAEYRRLRAIFEKVGLQPETIAAADLERVLKALGEPFRGLEAATTAAVKKSASAA